MKKMLALVMLLVFATSAAFAANDGLGLTKKAKKHKKEKQNVAAQKDLTKPGKDLTAPAGIPQAGK